MIVGLVCRLWGFLEFDSFGLLFRLAPALGFAMANLATIETLSIELDLRFVFVGVRFGVFAWVLVFLAFALALA